MTTSAEVRTQLIDALRLDLVGPRPADPGHARYRDETLPIAPSKWYLTGFLVPHEASAEQRSDDDGDDELDQMDRVAEGDDDNAPEQTSARKAYFPSSMGLSVLVPEDAAQLQVKITWGDYAPVGGDADGWGQEAEERGVGERSSRNWRRSPREAEIVVGLRESAEARYSEVPGSDGLQVAVSVRKTGSPSLVPAGTRSVSVFLVNQRVPAPDTTRDAAYVFQPELSLRTLHPFVPRPNLRGHASDDWDDKVADLQYHDAFEIAVGHNVSAVAIHDTTGRCREVRTAWMPIADVEKVIPSRIPGVELGMEVLAAAESAGKLHAMLGPMVGEYAAWIARQAAVAPADGKRAQVAGDLLANAGRAKERIQAGLEALEDPLALEAFRITNRVIATAIRRRACHGTPELDPDDLGPPTWRPFQLAFLLMNLSGVVDPEHADRKVVDLLFFPTGGGKTEAYLGLAAFSMVLRRLRDPSIYSAGLSVIMRYTLRLLTLDQLGRAATLMCALELERQQDVEKLGLWPFEIGLWVGQTATPNRMGVKGKDNRYSARRRTIAFQNDDRRTASPIPLENCPWCGSKYSRDSFQLLPDPDQPTDLRVFCTSRRCDFHPRRQDRGLPILAVDDPIYRRLPAFIIATVDKFANLPWVGETAGLFGRVSRYDAEGFYGPGHTNAGRALERPLPPPDLVIQDELHLISGPLGTLMGLYETAIDALCGNPVGAEGRRPKIVASTATVRRAEKQIRGLFGRTAVDIFPPPGPDRRHSFFAETVSSEVRSPRSYVGIAAQGRNLKVVLLRVYVALLAAGQKAWRANGGPRNADNPSSVPLRGNPADPYMTLLGYFNSLRELGGSRRIVEDEVRSRLVDYGARRRRIGVGLDITRLGLMVVLGQPKTASEYIQATSRVGRDDERPGLVVALLNVHRPRDRSHYERFTAWHESFYRAVEPTSVTPFSPRAIDRGIAAVAVALARLGHEGMTAPLGAAAIRQLRSELDYVAEVVSRRAEGHDKELSASEAEALRKRVRGRVVDLLDSWESIAEREGELQYQNEVGRAQRLLFDPLDPELDKKPQEARKFKAQRSLRDVEPTVSLWLRNPDGFDVEAGS